MAQPLWRRRVNHQIGVHAEVRIHAARFESSERAADSDASRNRAVMTEILINTRQIPIGLAALMQIHGKLSPSIAAAERGVEDTVVEDHEISGIRLYRNIARNLPRSDTPRRLCVIGVHIPASPIGFG